MQQNVDHQNSSSESVGKQISIQAQPPNLPTKQCRESHQLRNVIQNEEAVESAATTPTCNQPCGNNVVIHPKQAVEVHWGHLYRGCGGYYGYPYYSHGYGGYPYYYGGGYYPYYGGYGGYGYGYPYYGGYCGGYGLGMGMGLGYGMGYGGWGGCSWSWSWC